jgi:UDP-GlcNAc:undecaprenyl-phosphate GlcNAc-1-phosphate transferase
MTWFVAFLVALAATPALAHFARARGWVDRRDGLEERKPREAPVPLVGGAALLLALLAATLVGGPAWPWPALLAAFTLGTIDDRVSGGLSPVRKLGGQVVVAALLAFLSPAVGRDSTWVFVLAMVAMNAVNTWDNADGAAGGLALVALPLGPVGGAAAGFLPWNLGRRGGVPVAYLGDAGSHLAAVALVARPGAEWVLLLPLMDLGRLSVVRLRAGSRPWIGDRRHLAHRLEAAGLASWTIAALLAVLAGVPVWLGCPGALLTMAGFVACVLLTPGPCPHVRPSR